MKLSLKNDIKWMIGLIGYILGLICGFIWKEEPINEKKEEMPLNFYEKSLIDLYSEGKSMYSYKEENPMYSSYTAEKPIEKRGSNFNVGLELLKNENLNCPISNTLMTNPFIITKCGHTFQKECLIDWFNKKKTCPLCLTEVKMEDFKPNYVLKGLIDDLNK